MTYGEAKEILSFLNIPNNWPTPFLGTKTNLSTLFSDA